MYSSIFALPTDIFDIDESLHLSLISYLIISNRARTSSPQAAPALQASETPYASSSPFRTNQYIPTAEARKESEVWEVLNREEKEKRRCVEIDMGEWKEYLKEIAGKSRS